MESYANGQAAEAGSASGVEEVGTVISIADPVGSSGWRKPHDHRMPSRGADRSCPWLLLSAPFVAIISDIMVNELRAVIQELGGEQILGRPLSSDRDLREAIREGFPPAVVEELMRTSGLTLKELASALDLSPRSLQRRRRSGRLARYESDRLYRLARIVALANEYLGDHQRAMRWLKHPNRALGGIAPVAAIDTELGARQVENILGRIAYGGIS
jgi:putative toxin-antitoxin system antitoxin component (TIGR02293 family)